MLKAYFSSSSVCLKIAQLSTLKFILSSTKENLCILSTKLVCKNGAM